MTGRARQECVLHWSLNHRPRGSAAFQPMVWLWCRDAKPNKGELAILRQVIKLPPSKPLANHQKAQVSKFRYYLAKQSGTIVPFLKAVEWTNSQVRD